MANASTDNAAIDGQLAALQQALRAFNAERDWAQFHSPKNLAMCLAAEAGELLEPFMWLTPEASEAAAMDASRRQAVADEVGDVFICLLNLCDRLGLDPVATARAKLVKNAAKYPADEVRGRATK